jgi:predicted HicB family RNase H-like nuclease
LPAEDRGPRFLEWLEDVEVKFKLIDWPEKDDGVKKRKALLAVAGAEVRNKVGTLSDTGTGYADLVNKLKQDLLRDEPLVFLISQAMDMKQDEREGINDFVMRVRKKHQRINWDAMKDKYSLNDLMIGVTITRGTTSVNIREYCLSLSGVPTLDDVLAKGRSRESMKQHDREMIGNTDTAGRGITFKSETGFHG